MARRAASSIVSWEGSADLMTICDPGMPETWSQ